MPDDNIYNIQWFPGHMAKAKRMISESLGAVDAVIELRDARIPFSSANPDIRKICSGKKRITVLNKCDLAQEAVTSAWIASLSQSKDVCVAVDSGTGRGLKTLVSSLRDLLSDKLERQREKAYNRNIRVMVLGIPNVGKSTFINKLAGGARAKVENRPGVTRDRQWVRTSLGIDLLDMPGVLWPRFDDRTVAENLALTGAIRDDILDSESLALILISRLTDACPDLLCARYKLYPEAVNGKTPSEIFEMIAAARGMLLRGGIIDSERCSSVLLDEFRAAKIGRVTLEKPTEGLKN